MSRTLAVLTVLAAVTLSGVVQGVWSNRWGPAGAVEEAASRLKGVPMTLGEWDGQAQELSAREAAVAEINGSLLRRYVNRRTGSVVTLLIVCGRPGPVSVHLPEVCYQGAGYVPVGTTTRYSPKAGVPAEFKVLQMRKQNVANPIQLRILYSWGANGAWTAPDYPRVTFARQPALYKLYAVRELAREDEAIADDPVNDFLRVLLPELRRGLVAPS